MLLVRITNTLLKEHYGGATSKKMNEYTEKFDSVYRELHRTVTRARREDYKGLDTADSSSEEDTDDG
jgi:hypothetical protein